MLQTPDRPADLTQPVPDDVEAGVIDDARKRQQRQRHTAAAVTLIGLAIGALILGFAGGRRNSGTGQERRCAGSSPSAGTHVSARVLTKVIPTTRLCYSLSAQINPYPHVVTGDFGALDIPCGRRPPKGYGFLGESDPETVIALVNITFKAPLDVNNRHTVYEFSDGRASGPANCTLNIGSSDGTTEHSIRAGQTVMFQDDPVCPGTYNGLITYQLHGALGRDTLDWRLPIHDGSTIVGRFSYVVR
jgi:hypothetical protein